MMVFCLLVMFWWLRFGGFANVVALFWSWLLLYIYCSWCFDGVLFVVFCSWYFRGVPIVVPVVLWCIVGGVWVCCTKTEGASMV